MAHLYPITMWFTKSAAAKKLKINRKTIQRKIKTGELSQDDKGRIRWDELMGVLKADQQRGRRGPKIHFPEVATEHVISDFDPHRGLVTRRLEPTEATRWHQTIDEEAVSRLTREMARLSTASLEVLMAKALALHEHKTRLARLDWLPEPEEILAQLEGKD